MQAANDPAISAQADTETMIARQATMWLLK